MPSTNSDREVTRRGAASAEATADTIALGNQGLSRLGYSDLPQRLLEEGTACLQDLPHGDGPSNERDSIVVAAVIGAIRRLWQQRCRTIYALHPGFVAELADSTTEVVPWEILGNLAHPNPLVVFAEPPEFTNPDTGHPCRVRGFHVYGRGDYMPVHDTHTGDHDRLGLAIFTEYDAGTPRTEMVITRIWLPLSGTRTFDEALTQALTMFVDDVGTTEQATTQILRQILRTVVNVLMYLCCERRDEQPATTVRDRAARRGGKRAAPVEMVAVGYRSPRSSPPRARPAPAVRLRGLDARNPHTCGGCTSAGPATGAGAPWLRSTSSCPISPGPAWTRTGADHARTLSPPGATPGS